MKHITLHECYDQLSISDEDLINSITNTEADELYKFISKNKLDESNIIWGRKGITFINYVGYIKLSSFSIEIIPKIHLNKNRQDQSRKALLNILNKSGLIKVSYSEIGLLKNYNQSLHEILCYLFAKRLQNELVKGAYLEYISKAENTNVLKGKLIMQRHIKNLCNNLAKVDCDFEELCIDNILNTIFKYCINKFIRNISNTETIKLLRHCESYFIDVSNREINHNEILRYNFNRLNKRFEDAFILAKMLILGHSSTGSNGEEESFSLLFKMEEVFEKYIGNIISRNTSDSVVHTQHCQHKLLIKNGKDTGVFQLKPDIVIESNGNQTLIIDTKWKKIKSKSNRYGVKREDLYQMYAYITRYPDVENVILLYPYNEDINKESGEMLESWYLEKMPNKKVKVYSIALWDEWDTIEKLKKIVNENK